MADCPSMPERARAAIIPVSLVSPASRYVSIRPFRLLPASPVRFPGRGPLTCGPPASILLGQVRRTSLENLSQRREFLAKSLGRLKCSTQMGESILKSRSGLESRGELAQTFAERQAELAEFLVERFQR